jgi:DNA-binding SARP family transcriptional activator
VELDVLGPVRVRRDGRLLELGTPRQRAVVAALALSEGRVVPFDTVADRVWGDVPPPTATGTLQSYVGGLRKVLEPDRRPREEARVLVTEHDGYALRVPLAARDDVRLAEATATARALLQVVPDPLRPRTDAEGSLQCREAIDVVEDALSSWRGTPYADLGGHPDAVAERSRLADLRSTAEELRVVAVLALGRHDEAVPELEAVTTAHPLHERWWALYAVALVRAGRQADALAALQRLRSMLDDELGVDPSTPVRELQTAILRQDDSVTWSGSVHDAPSRPTPLAPAPRATRFRVSPPLPPWELVGRDAELARLAGPLEDAARGRARAAWISGEAGIGKTRLAHEVSLRAFERGFTVVTGTCGQVGAPDLWPWRQVFTSLEQQTGPLPTDVSGHFGVGSAGDFATWHALTEALRRAARRRPVVVVVEDVHDADGPTVGMLQHLVESMADERLLVLATRRSGAGEDDLLGRVARTVARRGGVRADLGGVDEQAAEELVALVGGRPPEPGTAAALWQRAGGNPFFLVEMTHAGGEVTGSLTDVVAGRLDDLPVPTREALEAAAVVGVGFDEDLVAYMLGTEPHTLADVLAPALAAGLLVEKDPVGRIYRFAHAVVRDVLLQRLPAPERNRWHAQVAVVLSERSGLRRVVQRTEVVRRWALAGYQYVGPAWRSLVGCAEQATLDGQHAEAARALADAVDYQVHDLGSGDRDRFELLLLRAEACHWAGDWDGLSDAADAAVTVAERLGEPGLAARAAVLTSDGVWQVRPFGTVHAPVVAALERTLARLDASSADDAPGLRSRARVALAMELYYAGDADRVDALVEEGLALADGLDDLRLLSTVLTGAFSPRWRPDTLAWREAVAERAAAVALERGDPRAQAVAATLLAGVVGERGDAERLRTLLPSALAQTRRLGLVTAQALLHVLEAPWHVLSGRRGEAAAALEDLRTLVADSSMPNLAAGVGTTAAVLVLWDPDRSRADVTAVLDGLQGAAAAGTLGDAATGSLTALVALRTGHVDRARSAYAGVVLPDRPDTYLWLVEVTIACELALGLGDEALARRALALATPYAGRMAVAGNAWAMGPVDAYLALAAGVLGDDAAARAHADRAAALGEAWGLRAFTEWFAGQRATWNL